jgi:hypothetical protein
VRTPAGFEARFRVHPDERVETLARHAERSDARFVIFLRGASGA